VPEAAEVAVSSGREDTTAANSSGGAEGAGERAERSGVASMAIADPVGASAAIPSARGGGAACTDMTGGPASTSMRSAMDEACSMGVRASVLRAGATEWDAEAAAGSGEKATAEGAEATGA